MRELKQYEAELIASISPECLNIRRTADNEYRAACPVHVGDGPNMSIYLNGTNIHFRCHSAGCTHDEIRDALGLMEASLHPTFTSGLTLQEYAVAKCLPIQFLLDEGLSTGQRGTAKCVDIPYWDRERKQQLVVRQRVSDYGKQKVKSRPGGKSHLYGLWRLNKAIAENCLFIVEGESDCHTLWHHKIPAVGVPGATCVQLIQTEIEPFVNEHPTLDIYVFQELGGAGQGFVDAFSKTSYAKLCKVVKLDEYKDPSELHINNPDAFREIWQAAVTLARPLSNCISSQAEKLTDLAASINYKLNGKVSRPVKEEIAKLIGDCLVANGRLLNDVSNNNEPYAITDDGSAVPIHKGSKLLRFALQDSGISPSEAAFSWTIENLQHRAVRDGKEVKLARYSIYKSDKLYVSAGQQKMVVVELIDKKPFLHMEQNGYDGVLFAADKCFSIWELTSPLDLNGFAAFRPCLVPADEVPEYNAEVQQVMLTAWLQGRIADVTMPILTCIGSMGSGKSITLRAIVKLLMGDTADISGASSDKRDFDTAVVNLPVYAIDNLDGQPDKWLHDDLATTCTGGSKIQRQLYSDSTQISNPITAKIAISTRTAAFASRPDIIDRILPLYYGRLSDIDKKSDTDLLSEVVSNRNGILTGLVEATFRSLCHPKQAELPGRFQEYNNLVVANIDCVDGANRGRDILKTWIRTQILSVSDPDPLAIAIIDYCKDTPKGFPELVGTPTKIVEILNNFGLANLNHLGGGKAIARKLSEQESSLRIAGISLKKKEGHNTTEFTISKIT